MSDFEHQSLSSNDGAAVKPDWEDSIDNQETEFRSIKSFSARRGGRPPANRPPTNRPPANRPPTNRPPNNNNRPPTNRPRLPKRVVVQQMIDSLGVAVAAAQLGVDVATLLGYVNGPVDD
ncbi:hypothetical protein EV359DRAFT_86883 [Lentinula novae-zelandiae]|nr:hypothetical protein EV359DRAFT_86883 [Lentinula novae-zelandiae]